MQIADLIFATKCEETIHLNEKGFIALSITPKDLDASFKIAFLFAAKLDFMFNRSTRVVLVQPSFLFGKLTLRANIFYTSSMFKSINISTNLIKYDTLRIY